MMTETMMVTMMTMTRMIGTAMTAMTMMERMIDQKEKNFFAAPVFSDPLSYPSSVNKQGPSPNNL